MPFATTRDDVRLYFDETDFLALEDTDSFFLEQDDLVQAVSVHEEQRV